MSTEVWYRKWRPQTFAEVVGQDHVTRTLARAVAQQRVAHAYLFCGPRGTGKTSTARILAKAVNCEANADGQPCTHCPSCLAVAAGRALDLVEMDAASNRGIDEIRELRDRVGYSPNASRYKVYLIDEAHELTQYAFDALLKTLEEPPPHVIFILATTEVHKVPETILSRCQRYDFVRVRLADVVGRLRRIAESEGVEASDAALSTVARRATGSLRDAENLFEQAVAQHGNTLTEEDVRAGAGGSGDERADALVASILGGRLAEALDLIARVRDDGVDLRQFTRDTVSTLRAVLLMRAGAADVLELTQEARTRLEALAGSVSVPAVLRAARLLTAVDYRGDPQSPLPLELAVVECVANEPTPQVTPAVAAEAASGNPRLPRQPPMVTPVSAVEKIRATTAPRTGPRPTPLVARTEPAPASTLQDNPLLVSSPVETVMPPAAASPAAGDKSPAELAEADATPAVETDAAAQQGTRADLGDTVLTLESARRRFEELYVRLKQIDGPAAALLNSGGCDIVRIDGGAFVLGFKYDAHLERAQRKETLGALQKGIAGLFGEGYTVQCVHMPEVVDRKTLLAAERPSHLLDEAQKLGLKLLTGTAQK